MKINSFEDAIAVVSTLNSIAALRNHEYPTNRWRFLFSWFYDILVVCVFNTSIIFLEIYHLEQLAYTQERLMYIFLIILYTLGFLCMVTLGLYYSKNTLVLKLRISHVDENLKRLGSTIDYRVLFLRVIMFGGFWASNVLLLSILYTNWLMKQKLGLFTLVIIVIYVYSTNIGVIVLYEFIIHVCWLGLRFKQTNDLLKTFLVEGRLIKTEVACNSTNEPSRSLRNKFPITLNRYLFEYSIRQSRIFPINQAPRVEHETQAVKRVHFLQEIRFVHLQLCGITKMVNRTFNAQLLAHTSLVMLYLTMILYYIYIEIYQSSESLTNIEIIMICLVDALCSFARIVLATHSCEDTSMEANKIQEIIHTFSVHEFDTEMKDEILQFSLQISLNQNGKTSKFNFFQLNYIFVRGCVSFVVTYLVIMIQWGQSIESDGIYFIKNGSSYTQA